MEYIKKAKEFCEKTGTKVSINFEGCNPCPWDEGRLHNEYKVIIKRNHKQMTVHFWDSLYNTKVNEKPTEYDILACLEKYDVGELDDFIADFGYVISDSKSYAEIMGTYKAVKKEHKNVVRVFGDVIEELAEIC